METYLLYFARICSNLLGFAPPLVLVCACMVTRGAPALRSDRVFRRPLLAERRGAGAKADAAAMHTTRPVTNRARFPCRWWALRPCAICIKAITAEADRLVLWTREKIVASRSINLDWRPSQFWYFVLKIVMAVRI